MDEIKTRLIEAEKAGLVKLYNLGQINKKDALILECDLNEFNWEECCILAQTLTNYYKENTIAIIPKGMELKKLLIEK